jgi:hypothetical protein
MRRDADDLDQTPTGAHVRHRPRRDRSCAGEQALRKSLEEARRLAAENDALRGELEVQLQEVRASRARIVQAAYQARRRLERDLHDGGQCIGHVRA